MLTVDQEFSIGPLECEPKCPTSIEFSYDSLEILGVQGNRVYVKGNYWRDDEPGVCVLVISRRLFERTLKMWLDAKKSTCEHYGHFCGVMGSLRASRYKERTGKARCFLTSGSGERVLVRTFAVTGFDPEVDMEHG